MKTRTDLILTQPFLSVVAGGDKVRITDATNCEHVFEKTDFGFVLVERNYQSKLNVKQEKN